MIVYVTFSYCCSIHCHLSIQARDCEFVETMSAQEYEHFGVEFDLDHPYVPTEKISRIYLVHQWHVKSLWEFHLLKCKKQ